MAVQIVDDSYIYGLIAGELDDLSAVPSALVYEVAVNAVRGIRQGRSRWPVDTSFSQQNFYADLDGSIWNNADYAKYVEDRTNAIHDYLRENIDSLIPEAAALVLTAEPDRLTTRQRRAFRTFRSAARQARELTRTARVQRRSPPTIFSLARESFRTALRPRRFDDEDDFEALF